VHKVDDPNGALLAPAGLTVRAWRVGKAVDRVVSRRDAGTMARVCWMCGRDGLTAEHAFPRWIRDLFRGDSPGLVTDHARGIRQFDRTREVRDFNATVRSICAACNNGWMARLESEAKRVLGPMILGRAALLEPAHQEILARWAVKTALVFQSRSPDSAAVGDDERHEFSRPPHIVPRGTTVRIAALEITGNVVRCAHWYVAGSSQGQDVPDTFSSLFILGHCLLLVAKTNPGLPASRSPEWDLRAPKLLPGEPVTLNWPPSPALTEADLQGFARSGFATTGELDPLPALTGAQHSTLPADGDFR